MSYGYFNGNILVCSCIQQERTAELDLVADITGFNTVAYPMGDTAMIRCKKVICFLWILGSVCLKLKVKEEFY
jgi:hypothetical protein